MASDPTPLKLGETALQQLEQLQARVDQLGAIAEDGAVGGLVAHEVRNLLTPAVAYVQIAIARPDDIQATHKALDRSLTAMRRACEVAELILACVKEPSTINPASGPPAAMGAPASDVARVISDCLESLGWDSKERRFSVKVDAAQSCMVAIPSDALRHVLLNLLLNARAALPERGGQIRIRVRTAEELAAPRSTWSRSAMPHGQVVIEVQDNGRGIEPSRLERIKAGLRGGREPPSRSASRKSPALALHGVRAAGLGLLLCDQLLASSGGQLKIESDATRGTAATIQLPAAHAA